MLATSHAIAGAIIAKSASTPELGYGLALLSHPLLDLFPHWDLHTRNSNRGPWVTIWSSLIDAGIGITIGLALFSSEVDWKVLLLTMFMAQLPDWLEAPYNVFGWHFAPFSSIKKFQHYVHCKMDLPWGLVPQIAILGLAVLMP